LLIEKVVRPKERSPEKAGGGGSSPAFVEVLRHRKTMHSRDKEE
jgi:hypothetical protein